MNGGRAARRVTALLLLASLAPASAAEPPAGPGTEQCRVLVRESPDDLESYRCYWAAARRQGLWEAATRSLEELLAADAGNHAARLYLAAIEEDRGGPRAEQLYREAADGFAATGRPRGEVWARLALSRYLRLRGRLPEAKAFLERAAELVEESDDPVLTAQVRLAEARRALHLGDYGGALGPLARAEELVFPDGPADLQGETLSTMGHACWGLGMYRRGIEVYEREADLKRREGDQYGVAGPRYNIALLAGRLLYIGEMEHGDYVELVRQALRASVEVEHRPLEMKSRLLLGQEVEAELAAAQFRRALELSRELQDRQSARQALRMLAQLTWRTDPGTRPQALRWVDETIADARAVGDFQGVARGLAVRALLVRDSGSRGDWIEAYLQTLDSVERIRDLQPEGSVRARVFTRWTFPYYRFAGRLLEGLADSPDSADDLELAFGTVERMRSRVLLDEMDGAGARLGASGEDPAYRRRGELLNGLAAAQKRLGDPELPPADRARTLAELDRLEAEEMALRDDIARRHPDFARLRAPSFPTLGELRAALAPDEALLSFQLAGGDSPLPRRHSEGGSWLLAVTRDRVRPYPLPEKELLENRIDLFLGLLQRRDGSDDRAAERLFGDLLGRALEELGPGITRLVIVPDHGLHRLPFGALRAAEGDPLAASYRISYTPSATVWMRWVGEGAGPAARPRALAFADPLLPLAQGPAGSGDPWLEGLRLSPLPHARREARLMARVAGAGSRVLGGREASEQALKRADLAEFGLLHFATHAVVDDARPERSAVLLSPGAEEEDGMLQIREIVDLDLDGQVVILSACGSASGTVLKGEGVVGLARAFLQAGARAVIGGLWPLKDDEAARLMADLARELGRGRDLASALAEAQGERIRGGDAPAAWAGLVLLGDGNHIPLPGGAATDPTRWPLWLAAGLTLVVLTLLALRLRRAAAARARPST